MSHDNSFVMGNVMNDYQPRDPSGGPLAHLASTTGGMHSYSHEEVRAFSEYLNRSLKDDPDMKNDLPLNPQSGDLFRVAAKGVLLCKLLNIVSPNIIDSRKLATRNPNTFQVTANHNLAISAARNLGLSTVNIGPGDLAAGTPHLVLGMFWQAIRKSLMDQINVDRHPEMVALLEKHEDVTQFVNIPPEQVLLRWFNYHLKRAGHNRSVNNFSEDIKDGVNYLVLLNQIAPHLVSADDLRIQDPAARAQRVLQAAEHLGCREFLTAPEDILTGNPKLNLAFVATLFNKHPTIRVDVDEDEIYKRALSEAEQAMKHKLQLEMDERKSYWEAEENERRKKWEAEEEQRRRQWEDEERQRRGAIEQEERERLARLREEEERLKLQRAEEEQRKRREFEDEERRRAEQARRDAEERERIKQEAMIRAREEQLRAEEERRRQAEEEQRRQQAAAAAAEEERRRQAAAAAAAAAAAQAQQQQYPPQYPPQQYPGYPPQYPQYPGYPPQYPPQYPQYPGYPPQYPQYPPTAVAPAATAVTFPIAKLVLTAIRANNLKQMTFGVDPYCKIYFKGGKQKTFFCPSTYNPTWNQDFDLANVTQNDEIVIQVWDRSKLKKNTFMGEVIVKGSDIINGEKTIQLRPRRGFPDEVAGQIVLRFQARPY